MAEGNVKEQAGGLISQAKRRVGLETPSAADDDGNVGIVRGALRAFGEGDTDAFLDVLAEEVVWEAPSGKQFPGSGQYSGRDEVRSKFVENIGRTYSSFGFQPESFLDAEEDDSVVVIGRFKGEGVEGKTLDVPGVQSWELKGNSVSRVCIFTDSQAFPEVITEEKEREREQEEAREDEQGDDDTESEGRGDAESEGRGDAESEGRGDAESEGRGDTESEGRGDAKSEGPGDAKSQGRGDAKSEGEDGERKSQREDG